MKPTYEILIIKVRIMILTIKIKTETMVIAIIGPVNKEQLFKI